MASDADPLPPDARILEGFGSDFSHGLSDLLREPLLRLILLIRQMKPSPPQV